MRFIITSIFLAICLYLTGQPQTNPANSPADTVLSKKITISGFCLCHTTVTDLKSMDSELQEVEIEEMDLCKDGFVQDSRFVNRKGYYSKKYPGILFQKDQDNDFISKFRLTKDFIGNLPDGTAINLKTLLVKDVLKIYPKFDTWRSRGCSEYWNLTNDTLSFFVKINKGLIPQYPVNEAYYAEKPIEGIDLVVSCYRIFEKVNKRYKQLFNDPVFFIDSVNVTRIELQGYQPAEIASVTVYKDTNAIKLIGEQGRYGLVYMETKNFARQKYWNYFKLKSADYINAVPNPQSDSSVVYILNNKVLITNFEIDLSAIDDKTFVDLKIIDRAQLITDFGIADKTYGILIKVIPKTENFKH